MYTWLLAAVALAGARAAPAGAKCAVKIGGSEEAPGHLSEECSAGTEAELTGIPEILIFNFKTSALPKPLQHNVERIGSMHPGWRVVVEDDAACMEAIRATVCLDQPKRDQLTAWFEAATQSKPHMRSEICRLTQLYKTGGVYIDNDFQLDKPLGELVQGQRLTTVLQVMDRTVDAYRGPVIPVSTHVGHLLAAPRRSCIIGTALRFLVEMALGLRDEAQTYERATKKELRMAALAHTLHDMYDTTTDTEWLGKMGVKMLPFVPLPPENALLGARSRTGNVKPGCQNAIFTTNDSWTSDTLLGFARGSPLFKPDESCSF